ncbi:hypothetical protein ACLOJK_021584 [Asimina triloba]
MQIARPKRSLGFKNTTTAIISSNLTISMSKTSRFLAMIKLIYRPHVSINVVVPALFPSSPYSLAVILLQLASLKSRILRGMASSVVLVLALALLSSFASHTYAGDPSPLQDFCVAINKNPPVYYDVLTK